MNEKQLEKISGAIITSFISLHFLEEVKNTGMFKQRVKNNLNRTIKDLIDIEENYFSKIDNIDDNDLGDKLVANSLEFVKILLSRSSFNEFTKMQEVCAAYLANPEEMSKLSDKILLENGAQV